MINVYLAMSRCDGRLMKIQGNMAYPGQGEWSQMGGSRAIQDRKSD